METYRLCKNCKEKRRFDRDDLKVGLLIYGEYFSLSKWSCEVCGDLEFLSSNGVPIVEDIIFGYARRKANVKQSNTLVRIPRKS